MLKWTSYRESLLPAISAKISEYHLSETTPLITPLLQCRMGGLIRGGLLYLLLVEETRVPGESH
jgi:hypothetical protein